MKEGGDAEFHIPGGAYCLHPVPAPADVGTIITLIENIAILGPGGGIVQAIFDQVPRILSVQFSFSLTSANSLYCDALQSVIDSRLQIQLIFAFQSALAA